MEIIQRRDIIRKVRDRWIDQYKHWTDAMLVGWSRDRTVADIKANLAALDLETCSVEDVDKALGVTGWADNDCDECDGNFPTLVRLGEEPDYEARWQDLCAECLSKALELLQTTKPSE